MIPWEQRPTEVANLLNPAFCAEVLRRCIRKFSEASGKSFPYPLVFLVLPIVLHGKTRQRIPENARAQLHVWLQSNQDIRIGFAERAREMIPFVQEAMAFLLKAGALTVDPEAGLRSSGYRGPSLGVGAEDEVTDCYRKAEILGRLFARAGTPTTIYTMWGVRP